MTTMVLVAAAMMTPWGEKVTSENCWREYPRPQMMRTNWTCLNGDWDYAVTSVTNTPGRPTRWNGKIRVPYPVESVLSGVGRLLQPDELLWYTRTIEVEKRVNGEQRILLHFDGVDFRAMVFIGHNEVTDVPHAGAQEPFTLDITDFVKPGANELTVCIWDPTEGHVNSRGKQSLKPHSCFYTRCSGIWQSVWMEIVPETYVADYNVVPDIDNGTVRFTFDTVGPKRDEEIEIEVFDAFGRKVAEAEADTPKGVTVKMPEGFKLWSPEEPNLYTFKAKLEKDVVEGYFAMRKFSKGKDAKGFLRFMLNNKPYYVMATLDQGWWPDGLLTPPGEEAMAFDIRTLKDCGFNTMRKHIKVEPRRYYALCDKLGLLVIQDLPCSEGLRESPFDPKTVFGYGFQRHELKAMVDNLRKVPSIVMWLPYNEGWSQPGQFLTHSTLDWVKRYDPSRLVSGPSGWVDFEGGYREHEKPAWTAHRPADACEAADTVDMHRYQGPGMPDTNGRRISFLGEFGGLGFPVTNHIWASSLKFGYGDYPTREALQRAYLDKAAKLGELAEKGLSGSVYTQTTDVEVERNGLMTYDRKVLKFDAPTLKKAHEAVIRKANGLPLGAGAVSDATPLLILHLDFNSVQMKKTAVEEILDRAAAMGYNAVLWEIENKVQWESHPEIVGDEAFTKVEFREILAHAKRLGLKPIPLFQTLGHGEYVLMHGGHEDWMEDPSFPACYCVSKPEVRTFMKEMIREYLELFGDDVKDFHLGCDEAKAFHTCPACRAKGTRFEHFLEHFNELSAELRAKGIKPGIWCDLLFDERETPAVKALADQVTVWFWDYKSDGYAHAKPQSRWQGRMGVFEKLGFELILATASESYRDSSYLPRYREHGANVIWGARYAKTQGYRGNCVTSWSMHCAPKLMQYPLWVAAAAVWKNPSLDGRQTLDEACLGHFGAPLATLESLTDWDWTICDFQGEQWGRLIKPAVPAPKTTLAEVAAEMVRKLGPEWRRTLAVLIGWYGRRIETGLKELGEPKTSAAQVLREGASLQLAYLEALGKALRGVPPHDLPVARSAAYYAHEQAPKSAALSAEITWSTLAGEQPTHAGENDEK